MIIHLVWMEDEGLFAAEDDQGTSYYFRGAVTNNYVKFGKYTEDVYALYDENEGTSSYSSTACNTGNWLCSKIASAGDDMYWRIVRINGDGSVRMIYGGTGLYPNGGDYSLGIRTIGTSSFNSTFDDNAHVGYMYGQIDASTYEATHENINNSDVKTTIDRWYSKYLNTSYGSYIANAVYCNDRSLSGDFGTGVGKIERYTTYRFWGRAAYDPNPSLRCEQVNDRFTLQGELITGGLSSNQDLIYPIGLLTADEAMFAGGVTRNNNTNYYLNCKDSYWTGTPDSYNISDGGASVWIIDSGGMLDEATSLLSKVDGDHDVRPVISLKPDSIKFGDGTTGNPFRMEQ